MRQTVVGETRKPPGLEREETMYCTKCGKKMTEEELFDEDREYFTAQYDAKTGRQLRADGFKVKRYLRIRIQECPEFAHDCYSPETLGWDNGHDHYRNVTEISKDEYEQRSKRVKV